MTQIYQYAVAALFIEAVVIFFYFQKRSLPTFQNILFLIILSVVTLTTVSELWAMHTEAHPAYSLTSKYLINCIYFTFTVTFGLLYAIYNLSVFDIYGKITRRSIRIIQIIMLVPYFVMIALVWLSPFLSDFFPLIFTIDPVTGYQRGNNIWFHGIVFIKAFYIVFTFLILYTA